MIRGAISFREDYTKLGLPIFATVRAPRKRPLRVGDEVHIYYRQRSKDNAYWGRALILAIQRWRIDELPDEFIKYDTERMVSDPESVYNWMSTDPDRFRKELHSRSPSGECDVYILYWTDSSGYDDWEGP